MQSLGSRIKRPQDLTARGIAVGMQDPIPAVRTLTREGQLGAAAIELCAPMNQFFYSLRAFFDQYPCGFDIAKTVACVKSVLKVKRDFVLVAEGGGNSALGILSCRFGKFLLGEHQYPASSS